VIPTICRTVHYKAYGTPGGEYAAACRAAVITAVCGTDEHPATEHCGDECVALAVLNPTGMFFKEHIPFDKYGLKGGTWHWPARETMEHNL
jgi:hypothetical protein